MICKKNTIILLYGKLKIEQHDPDNNKKQGVNSCALEW